MTRPLVYIAGPITGRVSIVGVDHIDTDTRGGWLSHGVLDAQIAEVDQ